MSEHDCVVHKSVNTCQNKAKFELMDSWHLLLITQKYFKYPNKPNYGKCHILPTPSPAHVAVYFFYHTFLYDNP